MATDQGIHVAPQWAPLTPGLDYNHGIYVEASHPNVNNQKTSTNQPQADVSSTFSSTTATTTPSAHSSDYEYGDVTDYESLIAACSGCHVIFHVAALVEQWIPDPSKFITVNVGRLKNVIKA
ncbi:dihydroflavonol-4-reductase [Artemisia annua]|uniref:Dihydroflavonol-4-reductase n=1 Tax=Artemisia annua TaxID=35608 RepID=A0A2U1LX04_ARTAN|nr:dihydroflavonol-4-reductase [Artemisia annua]